MAQARASARAPGAPGAPRAPSSWRRSMFQGNGCSLPKPLIGEPSLLPQCLVSPVSPSLCLLLSAWCSSPFSSIKLGPQRIPRAPLMLRGDDHLYKSLPVRLLGQEEWVFGLYNLMARRSLAGRWGLSWEGKRRGRPSPHCRASTGLSRTTISRIGVTDLICDT